MKSVLTGLKSIQPGAFRLSLFLAKQDDKKRKFIEVFSGKKINDMQFDLTFNCAAFTKAQIAGLIVAAMALRKMIPPEK